MQKLVGNQEPTRRLDVKNDGGKIVVKGSSRDETIRISEKDGKLHVQSIERSGQGGGGTRETILDAKSIKTLTIDAGGGNDRILVDESVSRRGGYLLILKGGKGNDVIQGGRRDEKIDGGKGNDRISAGGGNDWIEGGKGDDRLAGGDGDDKIYDRQGRNRIRTGAGKDVVTIQDRFKSLVRGNGMTRIGDDQSINALKGKIAKQFGVSIADGKDRRWNIDELETLDTTLAALPQPMREAARGVRFVRETMSDENPVHVEGDFRKNKNIRIYDGGADGLRGVIIHELAHAYDWKDGKFDKNEFWDFSGWRKVGDEYRYDRSKHNFARDYGETNPREDWATAVEGYFTDPALLKTRAPDKFEYLSKLFGP